MKFIKNKEYRVWWQDVSHSNEWVSYDKIDEEIQEHLPIVNLFHFVKETDDAYVFCSGWDEENQNYWDLVIMPKGCVKKAERIK